MSVAVGVLAALLAFPVSASATQPRLWQQCEAGGAAGQCQVARGVATDPETGHLYVADQINRRIDEFTAWGEFVKAWGWGVSSGVAEFQICDVQTGCQAGIQGSGTGQLGQPQGVAADQSGDIYVVDPFDNRVQKFSREGHFLLMFGGGVNETSGGDVCPRPGFAADVCKAGAGSEGSGDGEFHGLAFGSTIAIGPGGQVYVGDKGRIQEFDSQGAFQRVLPDPGKLLRGGAEEMTVGSLAADPVSGDLYFAYPNPPSPPYESAKHNIFRIDPASGGEIGEPLGVGIPRALAVGPDGSVYAFDERASGNPATPGSHLSRLLQFSPTGVLTAVIAQNEAGEGGGLEKVPPSDFNGTTGIAAGAVCFASASSYDVYAASTGGVGAAGTQIGAYGPPPDNHTGLGEVCEPPHRPPSVDDQYAISVGANDATLGAAINPHFWADTRYYVEYGPEACLGGECAKQPSPPGSLLKSGVVNGDVASGGVFLTGLQAGTTYHYRFVAQSSGGGPTVGPEATFTTFPRPGSPEDCPNDALRTGPSASLPDCRAYEMVSPVDKEGGDIEVQGGTARLEQSSVSGEDFTYSSFRPFAGAQSAPFVSQYLAHRDPTSGWQTESISPPQEGENLLTEEFGQLDKAFKAFSSDLSVGWNQTLTEPVLAPGGVAGFANIYRRNDADGGYQACTTAEPPAAQARGAEFEGASDDQEHAVFQSRSKLTPEASPGEAPQLYECSFDEGDPATVRLVSILPDGAASGLESTAGTTAEGNRTWFAPLYEYWLANAISADGSRVFWTAAPQLTGPGALYLRVNAPQPESARLHGAASGAGDLVGPAAGTGTVVKESTVVSSVKITGGTFVVGQEVTDSAHDIPAGTTIVAIEEGKLTLSKKATATKIGDELSGVATAIVSNVTTTTGAFQVGQEVSGAGIPAGATVTACSPSCGPATTSLTLSAKASVSETGATLSATSECTEAAMACTYPISEVEPSRFWGATPEGSKALFETRPTGPNLPRDLYLYDTAKGVAEGEVAARTLIAENTLGVFGVSEDLGRIYFLSTEAIGGEGAVGEPNLYLYEGGEAPGTTFIATLADRENSAFSPAGARPSEHTAHVSADGTHLVFTSHSEALAEATAGYDNTDLASGQPVYEVYRYAIGGTLACVSCNPSGARPEGREMLKAALGDPPVYAAARLVPWTTSLYPGRSLSEDGSRLFFEGYEPLVLSDTNGKGDVYEWEEAGVGSCEAGSPSYVEASGGCLSLISSGKSPADSLFMDASPSGDDAFFTTAESLVSQDPGSTDLYDARVEGGFAPEAEPPAQCEGEACQGTPEAPNDPTPASESFQGAGNVREEASGKPAARCAKGKVKRKGRCVARRHKKHTKKHRRRAGHNRRAAL